MTSDDDDQVLQDLHNAVARVSAAIRDKAAQRDMPIATSDPDQCAVARRVAAALGFRAYISSGAAEAAATAMGRRFDLILLTTTPDALDYVRRIRAASEFGAAPAIVALGGAPGLAWREDAAEAGMDAIVPAPVTPARLVDVIVLLLGAQSAGDADEDLREA